jgi:hypothetical protein
MNSEIMRDARLVLQVLEKEWWVWEYSMEGGGFSNQRTQL